MSGLTPDELRAIQERRLAAIAAERDAAVERADEEEKNASRWARKVTALAKEQINLAAERDAAVQRAEAAEAEVARLRANVGGGDTAMQHMGQWKYPEGERPQSCCYDCRLPYGGPGWSDVVVPDEVWELISPGPSQGTGLLCYTCMSARLEYLGMRNVPFQIASGPFSFSAR